MPESVQPLIRGGFSFGGTGTETISLPDGDYTLAVRSGFAKAEGVGKYQSLWLGTYKRIDVDGRPLTLSYPAVPAKPEPSVKIHIHFDITPDRVRCAGVTSFAGSANFQDDGRPSWHYIWLTPVVPLPPEERHPIALDLARDNSPQFHSLAAGKYWVHAVDLANASELGDQPNTYIASITAGGLDMSREPLVVAPDGTAPSLEITARNHCGILHMNYGPASAYQERYGIVRTFYGLLVPQFSAFENVHSFMFEPGQPQDISVGNLTPGHYKFYIANRDRGIPFREPHNIPADLGSGQDLWLKAGEKVDITVTKPAAE